MHPSRMPPARLLTDGGHPLHVTPLSWNPPSWHPPFHRTRSSAKDDPHLRIEPPCEVTNTSGNITFPQLPLRAIKIRLRVRFQST